MPISFPITKTVPIKPKKIPNHCIKVTLSLRIGPLNILVNTGCNPTINADRVADNPIL